MCQVPPRFVYKKFTNLHLGQNATKYAPQKRGEPLSVSVLVVTMYYNQILLYIVGRCLAAFSEMTYRGMIWWNACTNDYKKTSPSFFEGDA